MKNSIRFFLFAAATILVQACGNDKEIKENDLPEGMVAVDLTAYGKPFTLPVPDTANMPLQISDEADGALLVRSGEGFVMRVYEQHNDLTIKKDDLNYDEVNRLKRIIVDDANGLIWESSITRPEFHFVRNITLAGTEYSFEDAAGNVFSREEVEAMYNSAGKARAVEWDQHSQ